MSEKETITPEVTDDIVQAIKMVDPGKGHYEFSRKRAEWLKLFNFYNRYHLQTLKPTCGPCFPKVYRWVNYWVKELSK